MSKSMVKSCQVLIATVLIALILVVYGSIHKKLPKERLLGKTVEVSKSDAYKRTVIIPTLDSHIPAGSNVVWCSSFQLAWNKLKEDVIGEPLQIKGAEQVSASLNTAKTSSTDIPRDSCYATAGFVKDGIVRDIQAEMNQRFPFEAKPQFGTLSADFIVAYAYLWANIKFTIPYFENREEFMFTGSSGNTTPISSNVWS